MTTQTSGCDANHILEQEAHVQQQAHFAHDQIDNNDNANPLRQKHHCWSHSENCNAVHKSSCCNRKKMVHQDTVTLGKEMTTPHRWGQDTLRTHILEKLNNNLANGLSVKTRATAPAYRLQQLATKVLCIIAHTQTT